MAQVRTLALKAGLLVLDLLVNVHLAVLPLDNGALLLNLLLHW